MGDLLSEQDLITFIGLALTMKYKKSDGINLNLVDSRHMGHALSAMKYIAEVEKLIDPKKNWSRYYFGGELSRFITLRISPKTNYKNYPRVIDVLDDKISKLS